MFKKLTPAPKYLKSCGIFIILLCSSLYWLYLAFHTTMVIKYDSLSYLDLGQLINHKGFISYFQTGPNREPIYPLIVSLAIYLEPILGHPYTKIMALFGVGLLACSQIMLFLILRTLQIRTTIIALCITYFACSPSIVNSALSLYSEISVLPITLGIILTSHILWENFKKKNCRGSFLTAAGLGLLFALATLTKAVFEFVFPIYIITITILLIKKIPAHKKTILWCMLLALITFFVPINCYKQLNFTYNNKFTITNRWPWALYGNTYRRMEPLTSTRFLSALAYAPGEGLCRKFFSFDECDFWSFNTSDTIGLSKLGYLSKDLPPNKVDEKLIELSKQLISKNPAQYGLLYTIEAIKMFFWESTQIGFVEYPLWLERIYNHLLFKDILRLFMSLLTIIALYYSLTNTKKSSPTIIPQIIIIILSTICLYSFFFILSRYALPIAPLYLVLIAHSINIFIKEKI